MIETRGKGTKRRYVVRVAPYRSKTVYTLDAARKLQASLKNRKQMGEHEPPTANTLGRELLEFDIRRATRQQDLRAATIEGRKYIERSWKRVRPYPISELTREIIEDEFVTRAKKAPIQADKELAYIKACLREAASRGQRVDAAIFAIKATNKKPRRGWALTIDQLIHLSSWLPEEMRRIVPLAGMIGARQAFWFALSDDMFDLDEGRMVAPADLMKNRRDHSVVLTAREVALFREQLLVRRAGSRLVFPSPRGGQWSRHNFNHRVFNLARDAAAAEDVAFVGFTFHLLRHTAGSLMAFAGLDPAVAAERLGHTDGGALFLKTYRHVYEAERRRHSELFGAWVDVEWGKAKRKTKRERKAAEA